MGRGYTESQKNATIRYIRSSQKRIAVNMKLEEYEELVAYLADHGGEKVGTYIKRLIREDMAKGDG